MASTLFSPTKKHSKTIIPVDLFKPPEHVGGSDLWHPPPHFKEGMDKEEPEFTLDPFGAEPGEGILRRRRNVMDALRYGMLSTVRHYMGPMSMRTRGMAMKRSYKMPWTASNLGRTNVFVPEMGMPR